jgi:hypothetical protein
MRSNLVRPRLPATQHRTIERLRRGLKLIPGMGLTQLPWRGKLTRLGRNLRDLFMATTTFDTLKFANTLKAAGVPDKQAEAQANVLSEAVAVNFKALATKDDLMAATGSLRIELQSDIRQTEQRLTAKIDNLEERLTAKIDNLDARLTGKIDNLEQRHAAKIDNLEHRDAAKIDTLAAKFEGQFTLLKWMIGLSITLNVGVLIRLFFMGRIP